MPGQADTAPSLDDVAEFLFDNPGADTRIEPGETPQNDEAPAVRKHADKADSTAEESPDDESGDHPDETEDPDQEPEEGEGEEEAADESASRTSGLKFKVPVKAEDGTDTTIEVDEKELIAGYQRHSRFTQLTQELSKREEQAYQVVQKKLDEGRQHYLHETQKVHMAIRTLAGLKSDEEMAALAQSDPNAWVAENARAQAIHGVLRQIEEGIRSDAGKADQVQRETAQAEFHKAWGVLGKEGIDKPKLQAIFDGVHDAYGVPKEKLAKVTDPALVLILRDAMKFRELDKKAAGIKKVVEKAPPVPAARQPVPQANRANKQLDTRFRSGKASTRDLGRWLELNT